MPLPLNGDRITFSALPPGSYASLGEVYAVERSYDRRAKAPKGDFRLVNIATGASTYERPWAMRLATFSTMGV